MRETVLETVPRQNCAWKEAEMGRETLSKLDGHYFGSWEIGSKYLFCWWCFLKSRRIIQWSGIQKIHQNNNLQRL